MIKLYSGGSPNGQKMILMLEELELPYERIDVDVFAGDQYSPEFLKLNPISKYPVIVDPEGNGSDQPIFESGAILIYLAETYRPALLPASGPARWEALKWLMAQAAWVGPMLGQHFHFRTQPSEIDGYAAKRYRNQAQRVFEVLDGHLAERTWFAGDIYTIADVANYPWLTILANLGFDWADYPALRAWFDRVAERPAAKRLEAFRAEQIRAIPSQPKEQDFNRLFLRDSGPKIDFGVLALGGDAKTQDEPGGRSAAQ